MKVIVQQRIIFKIRKQLFTQDNMKIDYIQDYYLQIRLVLQL